MAGMARPTSLGFEIDCLVYDVSPVGWATCKWLKRLWRGCVFSRVHGLRLRRLAVPALPGDDWVRVRTLLGGICGTDLAILMQKQRPSSILQAYSSMPMLLGHENVAVVEDVGSAVDKGWVGKRVCVEPTLCCSVRGIEPACVPCQNGQFGACESFGAAGEGTTGLPAGTSIGYNSMTGGSYGEAFVAHVSQLVEVPECVSDEQAVLTDPVACGLHAALRAELDGVGRVLVYGAGMLGLALCACLRGLGYGGRIDALDVNDYLVPIARGMGADELLLLPEDRRGRFARIAERTGGVVERSRFGNLMLSGGYDVVFDCVGSSGSLNEALKWTRARGQMIMVGTGHGGGVDLTPIWFRELTIRGAYGRQLEEVGGRRVGTYQLAHEMMRDGKIDVESLLTHRFRLAQYRHAFEVGSAKGRYGSVKVAFDFR